MIRFLDFFLMWETITPLICFIFDEENIQKPSVIIPIWYVLFLMRKTFKNLLWFVFYLEKTMKTGVHWINVFLWKNKKKQRLKTILFFCWENKQKPIQSSEKGLLSNSINAHIYKCRDGMISFIKTQTYLCICTRSWYFSFLYDRIKKKKCFSKIYFLNNSLFLVVLIFQSQSSLESTALVDQWIITQDDARCSVKFPALPLLQKMHHLSHVWY